MAQAVAIAGLAFSVYQFTEQQEAQAQARQEREEAREVQQRTALAQNRRERQQAIERARRRRAAVQAQAQARGALDSSAVQGALGSLQSQTVANQSFQRQLQQLESQRLSNLDAASRAEGRAATAGALGAVPGQLGFSNEKTFANLFDQAGSFFSNQSTTGNSFQGVAAATPRNQ